MEVAMNWRTECRMKFFNEIEWLPKKDGCWSEFDEIKNERWLTRRIWMIAGRQILKYFKQTKAVLTIPISLRFQLLALFDELMKIDSRHWIKLN